MGSRARLPMGSREPGSPPKNRDSAHVGRVPILSSHSLRALCVNSSECKNRDPTNVRRVPILRRSEGFPGWIMGYPQNAGHY